MKFPKVLLHRMKYLALLLFVFATHTSAYAQHLGTKFTADFDDVQFFQTNLTSGVDETPLRAELISDGRCHVHAEITSSRLGSGSDVKVDCDSITVLLSNDIVSTELQIDGFNGFAPSYSHRTGPHAGQGTFHFRSAATVANTIKATAFTEQQEASVFVKASVSASSLSAIRNQPEHATVQLEFESDSYRGWIRLPESVEATRYNVADLDRSGRVDFADFLRVSNNFGLDEIGYFDGDVTGDGSVGFRDFLEISNSFGIYATIGATDEPIIASVPEPDTLLSTLFWLSLVLLRSCRGNVVSPAEMS